MPRLRYYKNFEVITDEDENESRDEERSELSGKSWWSNRNIISTISDNRLKQAINYHKQMVSLLEAELCGRISGRRIYTEYHESFIHNNRETRGQRLHGTILQERRTIPRNIRKSIKDIRRKHGLLAAEQIEKAWSVILEEYNKGV